MSNQLIKIILVLFLAFFASALSLADETVTVYTHNNIPREAFILFYLSRCPHCQRFDPVLKAYAQAHHIPVLAYTLDGRRLPSFPDSVLPTQREINRFFPNGNPVVPTLFLMNFSRHQIIPVLQGEANKAQLDRRLQQIHKVDDNDAY